MMRNEAVPLPDVTPTHRQALSVRLLVSPAMFLLLLLVLIPSALVIFISMTNYRLGASSLTFVWFKNYIDLAHNPLFRVSLLNTAIYVAIVLPLSTGLGLAVAMLMERRNLLRPFYRVAYFLPATATMVAMATVWQFLFLPNVGLFNQILGLFGFSGINFLGRPEIALYALAAIGVWEGVAVNSVLFAAGLSAIPPHLYDAAEIDGVGSSWERFRLVTWPMLGPTTMFVVVITALKALQVFDTVAVLTHGGPTQSTEVLFYTMYTEAFRYFRIGCASALTVVILALTIALALIQVRAMERRVHYS